MRCTATVLFLSLAACGAGGDTDATVHTLDRAGLEALPTLPVRDGTLLCTATGYSDCPLHTAIANRLDAERIALWEPGRTVRIWRAGDTMGTAVGRAGGDSGQYVFAMAVAAHGDGYQLVTADSGWRLLEYDRADRLAGTAGLPVHDDVTVIGFVGDQAVRQQLADWASTAGGHLVVRRLARATDSSGTVVLAAPVRWLRGSNPEAPPMAPLVASLPSWVLAGDGDVIWSPGDALVVIRQAPGGRVRWRLDGPLGDATTSEELDRRDSVIRAVPEFGQLEPEVLASLRSRSDSTFPMVAGLTVTPEGAVLVARAPVPGADSVDYLRLTADGAPVGRFRLGARERVLLAEGDSLLVHRPTEGEPFEVRWLTIGTP